MSNTVLDFHKSLPFYAPSPLTPIAPLPGVKKIYIKDESHRFSLPSFQALGLAWAIRNAIISELSETSPVSPDISVVDLASRAREAQMKLIAATDGNLGVMVARLGKVFGIEGINTRIFISAGTEGRVVEAVRDEGAEVIVVDGDDEKTIREAWLHSVAVDGVLVSLEEEEEYEEIPKWIVEGYSTLFKELDEEVGGKGPDLVVVPVGAGGLAQAAVEHYRSPSSPRHSTRILAVEPKVAAALHASLSKGALETVQHGNTVLKGMAYGTVSSPAWPALKAGLDYTVVVNDQMVAAAVGELKGRGHEVGPCTAAVLAGLKVFLEDDASGNVLDGIESIALIGIDAPI